VILGFIEPNALIGEVSLLDQSSRSAALITLENSYFIRIPAEAFAALRRNEVFENELVRQLTGTVRRASQHVRVLSTYSTRERLLWCLVRLARRRGQPLSSGAVRLPTPPRQELADMLGCTRETVSRELKQLAVERKIRQTDDHIDLDAGLFERYPDEDVGRTI
jgi:CRP-like cAMP-binding protein